MAAHDRTRQANRTMQSRADEGGVTFLLRVEWKRFGAEGRIVIESVGRNWSGIETLVGGERQRRGRGDCWAMSAMKRVPRQVLAGVVVVAMGMGIGGVVRAADEGGGSTIFDETGGG